STFPLRRGWGSTILPAAVGAVDAENGVLTATLHGLTATALLEREAATVWTPKSGTVSAAEDWGAEARIDLTARLVIESGGSVTLGAGSVVRCAPGVEIWVRPGGRFQSQGTLVAPVV